MYVCVCVSPGGHWHLSEARQQHGGGESDEGDDRALQEIDFTHEDVGGLSTRRDLLHEVHVHLPHTHTHTGSTTLHELTMNTAPVGGAGSSLVLLSQLR